MRVVIVGATGHIGTYLVPRLVAAGHEVIAISRGLQAPYQPDQAWTHVQRVEADREAEDADGRFVGRVVDLRPDAVVDLICFTLDSARQIVAAPIGALGLLLHCGTIWVHGTATEVPTLEDQSRTPFGDYGVQKDAIERLLLRSGSELPAAVLHPGHICGPGWVPINPAGNKDIRIWERLAAGQPVMLPNFGLETLHHVHADDVAQAFQRALENPRAAIGQAFHVASRAALTCRGFAEAVANWYGRSADLRFVPWPEYAACVGPELAAMSYEHLVHSPSASIEKAQRLLGYEPRFSSLQAVREGVESMQVRGLIRIGVEPQG